MDRWLSVNMKGTAGVDKRSRRVTQVDTGGQRDNRVGRANSKLNGWTNVQRQKTGKKSRCFRERKKNGTDKKEVIVMQRLGKMACYWANGIGQ